MSHGLCPAALTITRHVRVVYRRLCTQSRDIVACISFFPLRIVIRPLSVLSTNQHAPFSAARNSVRAEEEAVDWRLDCCLRGFGLACAQARRHRRAAPDLPAQSTIDYRCDDGKDDCWVGVTPWNHWIGGRFKIPRIILLTLLNSVAPSQSQKKKPVLDCQFPTPTLWSHLLCWSTKRRNCRIRFSSNWGVTLLFWSEILVICDCAVSMIRMLHTTFSFWRSRGWSLTIGRQKNDHRSV